jgi:positive regulator of sigma E activity
MCVFCRLLLVGHAGLRVIVMPLMSVRNTLMCGMLIASEHRDGEQVVISTDGQTAKRATVIAYVIPLFLMVVTLILVLKLSHSEGAAALAGVGILIPYYLVLFLLRRKISSEVWFQLEKGH